MIQKRVVNMMVAVNSCKGLIRTVHGPTDKVEQRVGAASVLGPTDLEQANLGCLGFEAYR